MTETSAIAPRRSLSPPPAEEEEALYPRHFLRADACRALMVIGTVSAVWGVGTSNDHKLYGWSVTFLVLLGVHAATWLVSAGAAAALLRSQEPRIHDRAVALFLVTTVLGAAYTISTRPPEYLGFAVTTTFGVTLFYLAVPGPLAIRTLAALGLTVATFWSSLRAPTPPIGLVAVVSTHVLSHALGLVVARWLEALRRQGFRAQTSERRAREELARKAADLEVAKERAETLAKARSEFLATMSHEFRTPMNAVLGMSDMLARAPLAAEHREMAGTIYQSARALLVLLNDILDLSKIDAGRMLIEQAPFDLRAAVRSAMDLVRYQATEKRLALGLTIAPDVPAGLMGDAVRLRQVLLNLLSNAVKFTERGAVDMEVRLGATEGAVHEIVFSVRDTGSGIPAEARERLFAPYEQGSASIGQRRGGTGLGLAICKRLVGMMQGEIRVESEVGKGSLFEFSIRAAAAEPPRGAADALEPPVAERRLRILLVDDNALNQRVAVAMLRRLGCRADVVTSGREAIEAMQSRAYDVALMDLRMPEMDGLEATRRIRASSAVVGRPRIVAMTASAFEEDRAECVAAGMDDFLSKPMLIEELYATLTRAAHAQPASQEHAGGGVLSTAALEALRGLEGPDNPGFFADLCRQFGDNATELVTSMAAAAAAGDATAVERQAHALKGMSGSVGATRLAQQSEALETSARRGDLSGATAALEAHREELSRVQAALAAAAR